MIDREEDPDRISYADKRAISNLSSLAAMRRAAAVVLAREPVTSFGRVVDLIYDVNEVLQADDVWHSHDVYWILGEHLRLPASTLGGFLEGDVVVADLLPAVAVELGHSLGLNKEDFLYLAEKELTGRNDPSTNETIASLREAWEDIEALDSDG